MPPSQLKRLKTSLRQQGVVGPQKSKKQRKQASKNGALKESRIQRNAALQGIREQFNPFEVKAASKAKYEIASNKTMGGRVAKGAISRPGVTKGLGEENRRKTLLVEMQRRKKVGGILDRRFGENDPTMTPEEKALERFVKEKQRGSKKGSLFDLEDADEDDELTHFGQSLSFDRPDKVDDFNEADLGRSDEDRADGFLEGRPQKRRRLSDTDATSEASLDEGANIRPEIRKSKKEVMEEVIAKSKLRKYERQQAKEDDDDLRAELDNGLPDLYALMRGTPRQAPPSPAPNASMNPDRLALLNGKERSQTDKEYDERLRQMAMDQRAKPTTRTLPEEEKLQQEATRLKELEEQRLRRMRGEPEESDSEAKEKVQGLNGDEDPERDEEDNFGLGSGLAGERQSRELGVEDEDEFVIEDNLIASGSELEMSDADESDEADDESSDDDDQEFVQGLLSKEDAGREGLSFSKDETGVARANGATGDLAYTYRCPETHDDVLEVTKAIAIEDLPTVVQRIRALYHPKLSSDNKAKLGKFATVLVDHISYLANQPEHPSFAVLEALIRHIHSLAKTFPEEIGCAFRSHLKVFHEERSTAPTPGDLIILTAIASIFPTSDHFHQVVTPAMLCMTRYLGQKIPQTLCDLATGTYFITLCLQYQRLSKRYIPEVVNHVLNTLWALSPGRTKQTRTGSFPHHGLPESLRLSSASPESRQLDFWDVIPGQDDDANESLKIALIDTHIALVDKMIDLWADKSAFCEAFATIYIKLQQLGQGSAFGSLNTTTRKSLHETSEKLNQHLQRSMAVRAPLRLHNHRPLAIKTSIPKFEESYNPDKHYDPDRDRAELSKLKAEHKREQKGALKELRKDANFIARESLREKKERDSAYEKKYKRLVAEIQGEEGREAKNYEREKRMRKGRK
ncbi:hypothetical protein OEA41_000990 [Lepraria neglecta]|uniref:Nop14-like protein n=1 Tax=Lepraria neglecta TaxID=209136 RepID=A0AAD9ZIZ6_9LECA|nr:hypothetical protein OEA41_000990 [Lepraria neglecta]